MISLAQKLARLADLFGGNQNGPGVPLSNRNYLVDGNFDQWTNGAGTLPTGLAYVAGAPTMYQVAAGTGGSGTIVPIGITGAFTPGLTTPIYNQISFTQSVASTGTVAAGTAPCIIQHVESVRTLSARSATYSVWLWCAAGTVTIPSLVIRQNFGTGGSPSAAVVLDQAVNWVVTTTPQRFSVLLNFPSIAGATFGTNGNDLITVGLWFPPGVTFQIYSAQWQLEQSSPNAPATGLPTAFEYRGYQAESARVARYYEYIAGGFYTALNINTSTTAYGVIPCRPKRGSPTVTPTAASTFYLLLSNSTNVAPTSLSASAAGLDRLSLSVVYSGMTAGQSALLQDGTGSSGFIVDARI